MSATGASEQVGDRGSARRKLAQVITRSALVGILVSGALMIATGSASATSCSSTLQISSTGAVLPVGYTNVSVVTSSSVIGTGAAVEFHPASGLYSDDTWSYGYDIYGSSIYWYFGYDKRANSGAASFIVDWCT